MSIRLMGIGRRFTSRVKRFFTEKPKSDFWMWAFITLFFFRWFAPNVLLMSVPLQIGLIAPETQIDFQAIASKVVGNIIAPMERIHTLGVNIALNNPLVAKIMFYTFGYMTYVLWFAMAVLIINLLRYGIGYVYRKASKSQKKKRFGGRA